ncbi:MAG: sigma-70 family RNA polymerase sigma factor [Oscillospiraceae bacterium]|nr:sigma-70 family RNA polymerase sigma factor [Oscillospiraceae bacterium]
MDDTAIVQLYWDRNENAIAETSAKYGHYCTSIAMHILQDHEDAEECVNDTYLNAWNAIPPHRPALLSTFLGKIVRNLSFNRYKAKHSRKRGGYEIPLILDELSEIVSDRETVEDQIDRNELIGEINAFLAALSAEKRYLFIRRYWYADAVADIAKSCGKTENAVSVELGRLRGKLRSRLTERGYDL